MIKDKKELSEELEKLQPRVLSMLADLAKALVDEKGYDATLELLGWNKKKLDAVLEGEGNIRINDLGALLIASNMYMVTLPITKSAPFTYGSLPDEEEEEEQEDTDEYGDEIPSWEKEDEKEDDEEETKEESDNGNVGYGIGGGIIAFDAKDAEEAMKFLENLKEKITKSGKLEEFKKMIDTFRKM